ncbi:Aminotransferase class I/II-fold pyridoxal phosphate-dependent enzyme [Planctomycetales bacterium 10988]|nr:Aminotransferase class I/II-fold pyridoxal phosphate-dependent enzyme [Planctomycetales bacterium 10988]
MTEPETTKRGDIIPPPEMVYDQGPQFKIDVADRLLRLPPYLFGRINALKMEKRRSGDDVIDLGMGNPSDPPQDWVIEKLAQTAEDLKSHGYSHSIGIPHLRREVAHKYSWKYGVQLDSEAEVVACLGSKEGFSHLCLALLGPGDTAIVPAPSFPIHVHALALASANVISLDVSDEKKFLRNIVYTCEQLYPKPKLLVVNFPHNPSSATVDSEFFVELIAIAKRFGFLIVHDFAYADIGFDGYQPPSILSVPGAKEIAVEFTTMSKGYNMAGWRVGFCAGNSEICRSLATIKGYYDYGMFLPVQVAAIMALRHGEDGVKEQSMIYQHRRDILCSALRRIGWEVETPRAGMFVWAKYPESWQQRMKSIDFAMFLLREANVAVSPGGAFGPVGEGYLRLALVENEHRLRQAVRQISRCLQQREPEEQETSLSE